MHGESLFSFQPLQRKYIAMAPSVIYDSWLLWRVTERYSEIKKCNRKPVYKFISVLFWQ